jgi:hypothetical protein
MDGGNLRTLEAAGVPIVSTVPSLPYTKHPIVSSPLFPCVCTILQLPSFHP